MDSTSSGKTMLVVMLVVGLVIGFGAGYLMPALITPADDLDIIQAQGTIVVGTNSGWPPFEMVNAVTGDLEGFDIDLAELCADYLNVTVEWVDMDFGLLVGACQTGSIDMIASATFITKERCDVLEPLCWYIRTNEVIVVMEDSDLEIDELTDLTDLNVGVQTGTTEDEGLSEFMTPERYEIVQTMFLDLESGLLDAIYVDEPIVDLYSETFDIKIIFTNPAPPTAFYIRYGNPKLSGALNSAIALAFKDGTLDELIAKWFG